MRRQMLTACALLMAVIVILSLAERARTQALVAALPQRAASPADNPSTPEKIALGRLLFWDPILSGSRDVACSTCHHPQFGYSDNLDTSVGAGGAGLGPTRRLPTESSMPLVKRNSQTLLNVAFNGITQDGRLSPASAPMFWDVRVKGLEAQALEPIKAREEMRGDAYPDDEAVDAVVARLNGNPEYRRLFSAAFSGGDPVTASNLGKALAAFERSLVAANSPFDRYMRGDRAAMTAAQVSGMERFQNAGCANCHNGPMFSDYKNHVLGVPDNSKLPQSDAGVDRTFAFRTPSLRNLAFTAPYMHGGVFRTLDEVLRFYNNPGGRRGFGGTRNPQVTRQDLDPLLRRLNVRGGRRDLIEFLGALNDDHFDRAVPERVPSGLAVGGNIQPRGQAFGVTPPAALNVGATPAAPGANR